jgi:hypothetical protein
VRRQAEYKAVDAQALNQQAAQHAQAMHAAQAAQRAAADAFNKPRVAPPAPPAPAQKMAVGIDSAALPKQDMSNVPPQPGPPGLQSAYGQEELEQELVAMHMNEPMAPKLYKANTRDTTVTVLPKAMCTEDGRCLRKFQSDVEVVAFIHIGKAGGTSFDGMLSATVTRDGEAGGARVEGR